MKLPRIFKALAPPLERSRKTTSVCPISTIQVDLLKSEESESDDHDDIPSDDQSGFDCKEDEDVAMFLSLVDKMALKSLLFILQNHARSMNNICEAQLQGALKNRSNLLHNNRIQHVKKFIIKKCRFAEISGGQVRTVVHEIPLVALGEEANVWWRTEEIEDTRREAHKGASRFLNRCPEYEESIRVLAGSFGSQDDEMLLDQHIKLISKQDFPRGLESLICSIFLASRAQSIQAVLREQEKQRHRKIIKNRMKQPHAFKLLDPTSEKPVSEDTLCTSTTLSSLGSDDCGFVGDGNATPRTVEYDESSWNRIRDCYRGVGTPCRTYALRIAKCDELQALKAAISAWK